MEGTPSEDRPVGPKVIAAIDIGTNAIRMAIAQILDDGQVKVLERLQRPVRLGQDTFRKGRLRAETMRTAVGILRGFLKSIRMYGADSIRAVATSSVREASNGDAFIERIWMATGIEVTAISVAEESRVTITAVYESARDILKTHKKVLVTQVGGGSTVINLLSEGKIVTSQNLPIGTIRQQEILAISNEPAAQAAALLQHQVGSAIRVFSSLIPLENIETLLAVGQDMRWAATQVGKADPDGAGWTISEKAFEDLVMQCHCLEPETMAKKFGVSFRGAETLNATLLIYQVLLRATRVRKVIVPNASMLDGLVLELSAGVTGAFDSSAHKQTIRSARAIGRKYHVDESHSQQVRRFTQGLFDRFQQEHRLPPRCRLLLEVAALLHEIGTFVASRSHHKHTLYLIQQSEVYGLTLEELRIVANVARYHRRSRPKPSHGDYMSLDRTKRMLVNKLAALLRIADALDVARSQQIESVDMDIHDEALVMRVSTGADLRLEAMALAEKGDLFRDIYGLDLRIERQ